MEADNVNILIGGEAGQGLMTVGEVLSKTLVRAGYPIVVTQSYMSRIRGGHNTFAIRVSGSTGQGPRETVDLLVALNAETVSLHEPELAHGAVIIADETFKWSGAARCMKAPFGTLAAKEYTNIAALGVAACLLRLDEAALSKAMESQLGNITAELVEGNRRALANAYAWASSQPVDFPGLVPPPASAGRLMMNGNDGIAMGALAAGVKFCSFYPMTPSTSIPLALAKHAATMGLVVEQAEDEIAAINMALGAAFAGAPSLVATSGGGFALMAEGVSLAAMTETPVVVVVGQRPGPATGLPTRTEQGDLNFVLYAGHGEFPRAIFTPGSVEECYDLTRKAFELADKYQGPVFVLTDQFLADSYRDTGPFQPEAPGRPPLDLLAQPDAPYVRYAITASGISPRRLPGMGRQPVVADSDEHTEDGHITEDLAVRRNMVDKRLRKLDGLKADVTPPRHGGEQKPRILLVSWGSTLGAVTEAMELLRARGIPAGNLHFPQVWPLVPDTITPHFDSASTVVMVESNATGQMAGLIQRETGFRMDNRILRYDGLPMTAHHILEALKRQGLIHD